MRKEACVEGQRASALRNSSSFRRQCPLGEMQIPARPGMRNASVSASQTNRHRLGEEEDSPAALPGPGL